MPSLVEIGKVVLEKKSKKFTDTRIDADRRTPTGKRGSEKLAWAFRSGELKVNLKEKHEFFHL